MRTEKESDATLEDLFLRMSYREENSADANDAFRELQLNYSKYLKYICSKFKPYRDKEKNVFLQECLVSDVFNLAYLNAGKLLDFKNGIDEKQKELLFRSWLSATAKNCFKGYFREDKKQHVWVTTSNLQHCNDNEYETHTSGMM